MGISIKSVAGNVKQKAEKAGRWVSDHRWDILSAAWWGGKNFLLGYGIGALLCDVTGLTDAANKTRRDAGKAEGYLIGYSEGQQDAAKLIATANGTATEVPASK